MWPPTVGTDHLSTPFKEFITVLCPWEPEAVQSIVHRFTLEASPNFEGSQGRDVSVR